MAVSTPQHPISLRGHLGALVGDSRCFALDDEAYPIVSSADLCIRLYMLTLTQPI